MTRDSDQHDSHSDTNARTVSRRTVLRASGVALAGSSVIGGATADHGGESELFHADFSSTSVGDYYPTADEWGGEEVDADDENPRLDIRRRDRVSDGNKYLNVYHPEGIAGNDKSGADFQIKFNQHYDELYLGYRVRFDEDFEFHQPGGKLPGLIGTNGEGPITGGDDPDGENGWSARMMWVDPPDPSNGGRVCYYTYHPDQPENYGDEMFWDQGPSGQQYFKRDEWHEIEHRIKMNTPGEKDGVMEGWFDGEKSFERRNLRFWDIDGVGINRFYFSTFFGGDNTDKWAHDRDENVQFDDIVASTKPIWNGNGGTCCEPKPPEVTLELRRQTGYETGNLGVTHTGGDTLDTTNLTVLADGVVADDGCGWDTSALEAGDDVWYQAPDTGAEYFIDGQDVTIVHDPTDSVVATTTLGEPETPDATLELQRQTGYYTGNLNVTHTDGETLDTANLTVLADGTVADDGDGWTVSSLEAGDDVWYQAPDTGAEYFIDGQTVEIIHDPTGSVLAETTLADTPDATLELQRQTGYETGNLNVTHTGGDTLDTSDLTVLADGTVADDGDGWTVSSLDAGDDVWYQAPNTGAAYFIDGQTVEIIHDPTDSVIAKETLEDGPDVTLELQRQTGYHTGNLNVTHTGGDTLDTANLTVLADGVVADDGDGWTVSSLNAGDDVWYQAPDTGAAYFIAGQTVEIIHDPTGSVIAEETLEDGPDVTLELQRQTGYHTGNLNVTHTGGDTLETANLTVLADGEVADAGDGWAVSSLEAGDDVWYYAPSTGAAYFMEGQEVSIVHEPTTSVVATATLKE